MQQFSAVVPDLRANEFLAFCRTVVAKPSRTLARGLIVYTTRGNIQL